MLELVLQRGGKRLIRKTIESDPITIGRDATTTIRLTDDEISRTHCTIERDGDDVLITDRSTNGTFVNGKPCRRANIIPGDRITLGPWTMAIEAMRGAASTKTVVAQTQATQVLSYDARTKEIVTEHMAFTIRAPGRKPKEEKMAGTSFSFGTQAGCTIMVDDAFASRHHCKLALTDSDLKLIDLGSTNGTFIDDMRIEGAATVAEAGTFRIGQTTIAYRRTRKPERIDPAQRSQLGRLIGASLPMREIYSLIEKVGPSSATVCITGESGTGKELVAHELHEHSTRAKEPFVALNCGAIPASIIESLLFGHERGAFTGATERSLGLVEQANGGTLFLDEIGEMPMDLQARLLRVLETRSVRRIGGSTENAVDFRLICATNRDLKALLADGRFREDLFFRLYLVPIEIPPLRERRDDIPLLARHLIDRLATDERTPVLSDAAIERLTAYRWPGNVRELKHTIERSVLLAKGHRIDVSDLKIVPLQRATGPALHLRDQERGLISETISACEGNLTHTARRLGIARTTLQKKMKRLDIPFPSSAEAKKT